MAFLIKVALLLIAITSLHLDTEVEACEPWSLYWRDYDGQHIPDDAVPVGPIKKNGRDVKVYLGQVYLEKDSGLQPVAIYPDTSSVISTYNGTVYNATQNIKVLCTNTFRPHEFVTWIRATHALQLDPDRDLVIAGYQEENGNLYFGRKKLEGEVVISKVIRYDNIVEYPQPFFIWFPWKNQQQYSSLGVEILVYTRALQNKSP